MRKLLASFAVLALLGFTGGLYAQATSEITSPDANKPNTHDRSAGHAIIKVPAPATPPTTPPEP
ncbi:MAG: hypothetical protein IT464_15180, partial [Planctomycetes bacterium]|nr:hypothetical protein [Planctomycetota bacterium]